MNGQWKQTDPALPALSAVYRALQRHSLDQRCRRYLVRQVIRGPSKAFEAPWVNELWMSDKDWLDTPAVQKAFTHLTQCATLRSVMLLSGLNGVGKSALAGRWIRGLDERLFHPLCLTQATLSGSGILSSLTSKLGKAASFRRERNLQLIEKSLEELDRRILLIVLDEAQNYTHGSLEEVRLLLGLNLPQAPAFALILIGDE